MTAVVSLLPHLEAESSRGFTCSIFPDTMGQCIGSCLCCRCPQNSIAQITASQELQHSSFNQGGSQRGLLVPGKLEPSFLLVISRCVTYFTFTFF